MPAGKKVTTEYPVTSGSRLTYDKLIENTEVGDTFKIVTSPSWLGAHPYVHIGTLVGAENRGEIERVSRQGYELTFKRLK